MRSHSTSTGHRPGERGVALVLTLSILALVTLLLIAFVGSMRVENAASKNFNEVIKARELAQAGVDEAVGVIRLAAPPVSTLTNYVTAPGAVYTWANGTWTSNSLFTSVNTIDPPNPSLLTRMVNLNTNFVITGSGTVYNVANALNSQLLAGWSNVTVATTVNGNPQPFLVGRYAYWVDDESAKVNLNTAGMRTDDPQGLTPGAIDLGNLGIPFFSSAEVVSLTNYVHYTQPLDTIQSMVMTVPPMVGNAPSVSGSTFSNTQFYVTTHSTSPDVTPWGTQRINLNNLGSINGTSTLPTMAQKLAAVGTITTALSDPNLSTWFGQTFAGKYNQAHEIQQIAANIVDYISVDNNPTDSNGGVPSDPSQPLYLGLKETPYLNQLAIVNTFTITAGAVPPTGTLTVSTTYEAQLWYLYNNSAGWPANGAWVQIVNAPSITLSTGQNLVLNTATIPATSINSMIPPSSSTYPYQLVSVVALQQQSFPVANIAGITRVQNPGTFTAVFSSPSGRMDWAQVAVPTSTYPVPSVGTITTAFQATDPRIKPSLAANWSPISSSQLGSPIVPNTSTGNGTTLPGDGVNDTSCHVVAANLPNTAAGATGRQRGQMCPSELAYIHTGIPWRTLWLEPQPNVEGNVVPDWLAVDLFSGSSITNVDVPGRMNINAAINSAVGVSGTILPRLAPLDALLGMGSSYAVVAPNIYDYSVHNLPSVPSSFVQSPFKAFTTAGQVCQVVGLADAGTSVAKATREAPGPGNSQSRNAPFQYIYDLVRGAKRQEGGQDACQSRVFHARR